MGHKKIKSNKIMQNICQHIWIVRKKITEIQFPNMCVNLLLKLMFYLRTKVQKYVQYVTLTEHPLTSALFLFSIAFTSA